jgi:hypothetical protein
LGALCVLAVGVAVLWRVRFTAKDAAARTAMSGGAVSLTHLALHVHSVGDGHDQ